MKLSNIPRSGEPIIIPLRVAERALCRFVLTASGCFESTYAVSGHGYAQIGWGTKVEGRGWTTAHRAAWVAIFGQIPLGWTIDHQCFNRRCVNVGHLHLMTISDNVRHRRPGRSWPTCGCNLPGPVYRRYGPHHRETCERYAVASRGPKIDCGGYSQ